MNDKSKKSEIKRILKEYSRDVKLIQSKEEYIQDINSRYDIIKTGIKDNSSSRGISKNDEDRILFLIETKEDVNDQIEYIRSKYIKLKYAINKLDDIEKEIINNVWVYNTHSIRKQAEILKISKSTVHNKSEKAMLKIYDFIYNY